jgi:D-glycero-D-manno-heptose 1,7-bisphosphate phosphatase
MKKNHDILLNLKLINSFKKEKKLFPCLFLDRDGVVIKDCHYIKNKEQVILEKGALELINKAYEAKWIIVIITNQSGINRGIISWNDYNSVTREMLSNFKNFNPFAGIYANSLGPNEDLDSWRKPSPKMIFKAAEDLPIDLEKSILIGDRMTDLLAGLNAKIPLIFHVKTGHGEKEREEILKEKIFLNCIKNNSLKKQTIIKLIDNLDAFPLKIIN